MGQYYKVYTKKNDEVKVFDRSVIENGNKNREFAKLMEHSWWLNTFVCTFSHYLYEEGPMQVAWVGDYAEFFPAYARVWGDRDADIEPKYEDPLEAVEFTLDGKYLVNYTLNEFVNCDDYKFLSDRDGWCIHPIPLLTCSGNGLGGGDYLSGIDIDYVGTWCNDIIGICDNAPDGMQELTVSFVEERRI